MELFKKEAKVTLTRDLREQFLCPICYDTIEVAHRVFPCLRKLTYTVDIIQYTIYVYTLE